MHRAFINNNRPVHLARRDAFFECAVEVLYAPRHLDEDIASRLSQVEQVLSLLRRAEKHGFLTADAPTASQREHDFLHFIGLIAQNVQSAHAMMLNQMHLEEEESFLRNFLSTDNEAYTLPAMDYGRRAEDILKGLWHVLRLALAPYRTMQRENISSLDEPSHERYKKAYQSVKAELGAEMA
jgi:hypothetical protein